MNKQNQINSADTIFNNNVPQMDHRFETPPQKKLAPTPQAINSSPSPYKVNLASIFRTPNSIKSMESMSGKKTLMKVDDNEENYLKMNAGLKESSFQRKLPIVMGNIGPMIQGTSISATPTEKKNYTERQNQNTWDDELWNQGIVHKQIKQEYNAFPKPHFDEQEKQVQLNDPNITKSKSCNCKRTKCLKLYCDCFSAGELCGIYICGGSIDCSCQGCHNNKVKTYERSKVVESLLEKNPNAFNGKINKDNQIKSGHMKGCNCRKSGCQKKYCECFSAGVKCNELCKCETCKNFDYERVQSINARKIEQLLNSQSTQSLSINNGYLLIPTSNKEIIKQFQQMFQFSENGEPTLRLNQEAIKEEQGSKQLI